MAGTQNPAKTQANSLFRRYAVMFLVTLCLLGAGLRLYKLDEKSLWGDELATIASAQGNSINPEAYQLRGERYDPTAPVEAGVYLQRASKAVSDKAFDCGPTAHVLRQNVHPPLFFCLMHSVIHYFGHAPLPLRMPAALFGIFCLPFFYWAIRKVAPPETALLATAFLALSGYQLDHSQDARQYTLLTLLSIGSVGLMLQLKARETPWDWTGLVILSAVGLYTQYFYAPFLVFVWGYLGWQKRTDKKFLLKLTLAGFAVILLFIPWLESFKAQMAFHNASGHFSEGLWKPIKLPEKLFRSLNEFMMPGSTVGKILMLVFLIGSAVWGLKQKLLDKEKSPLSPVLVLALWWVLAVIGGQLAIDIVKNSHTATVKRYLLLAAPGFYLLISHLLISPNLPRQIKVIKGMLIGAFIMLLVNSTCQEMFVEHHSSDEFKQAGALIAKNHQPNDLVIVNKSGTVSLGMAYYLPRDMPILPIDAQSSLALEKGSPYLPLIEREMDKHRRMWLVFSHEAPSTKTRLTQWMGEEAYTKEQEQEFPGVHVYLYKEALPD